MEKMNNAFEKMKMLVRMEADEEEMSQETNSFSLVDDFNRNCTLTTTQRLYGFAICLASGLTCTFLSILVFFHPIKFGITFTFGNLLALGSTGFLIGPKKQINMMLDPVRIYATAMYLASMIIALFCAFYAHSKLLTLLAIILEFGALICISTVDEDILKPSNGTYLRYSLSYIPFARSMVSKIMSSCLDTEF